MTLRSILLGAAAGAVGTIALDVATYTDMVARARPASTTPSDLAGKLTEGLGIELAEGGGKEAEERASNRKSGIGALFGYATGVAVGALYGALRPATGKLPAPLAGIALGLAAMAASDVPIAATGVSDPREWGAADWASDLIPHLLYGLVTVVAFESFHPLARGKA